MGLLRTAGTTLGIAVFTVVETVTLGGWLALVLDEPPLSTMVLVGAGILFVDLGGLTGVGIAGVVLFVLMLPQHSIEDNVLKGRALSSNVLEFGTAGFTLVETVGGTVWLALIFRGPELLARFDLESLPLLASIPAESGASLGMVFLAIAPFVEHVMGVQFALRMGERGTGV